MIKELELVNWCQHRHHKVQFAPGLTAIIGPNGSGKSNLMGAVMYLWTGENPNTGNKVENICELAGPTEPSYCRFVLVRGNDEIEVKRSLRPASAATLCVNGREVARGERDVTAKLSELTGVDPKTALRHVLVKQADFLAFLDEEPRARVASFQQLFDTTAAVTGAKVIADHTGKIVIPHVGSALDEQRLHLVAATAELDAAVVELGQRPDVGDIAAAQAADARVASAWQAKDAAMRQKAQLEAQLASLTVQRRSRQQAVDQLEGDARVIEDQISLDQPAAEAATAALANFTSYTSLARSRLEQENRIAAQRASIETTAAVVYPDVIPPPYVDGADPIATARVLLERSQVATGRADEVVRNFVGREVAECHTCHRPTNSDEMVSLIAEAQRVLSEERPRQAELSAYLKAATQVITNRQLAATNLSKLRDMLAAAENTLAGMPVMQVVEVNEQQLRSTVASYSELCSALPQIRQAIASEQARVAQLDGSILVVNSQLQTAIVAASAEVTEDQAREASHRIAMRESQRTSRELALCRRAAAEASVTRLRQVIASLEQQQRDAAKLTQWVQYADAVQSLLKAVPRFVVQRRLMDMEADINATLAACNSDFRVTADEDLSFTGHFVDGRHQPARRFSGGQKTLLALLLRVVINTRWAHQLGLLALDEPTAWLDEQRIADFGIILDRLRAVIAQRGLQVIIITHEPALGPLFDHVISLD